MKANTMNRLSTIAMQYVDDHIQEKIKLQELADSVHLSVFYYCRKFREESGLTPKQFVINRKLAYAANLLEETNLKVWEIAERIGYDAPRFTTLFRKSTGCSPCDYRRIHLRMNASPGSVRGSHLKQSVL